jgi:uncharacterized protein YecE (DUF72 family)
MARKWLDHVSENSRFQYTAKLWQVFTHNQDITASHERELRSGMEVLRDGGRLGAVLAQFPWSFKNTNPSREYMSKLVGRFKDFPLVVEVRHASWNNPAFLEWLAGQGVGFCNIDQPVIGRSMGPREPATAPVGYVRLHGRNYQEWFAESEAGNSAERYNYLYSMGE